MKKVIPLAVIVLVLLALALYLSTLDKGSTARIDQTDFAIADTAAIGKIFIADRQGRTVTLVRQKGMTWSVNDQYTARPDAVELLLRTFKNVYIQRPVNKAALEQVNRIMAAGAKKVEVYDLDGKWIKTWYVGHGTMDKKGTFMLLETPKYGKAEAPYIIDMKGFLGMLDTRFFTNEQEWRSPRILQYPDMDLREIEVFYPTEPQASFRIVYGGGNDIQLYARGSQATVPVYDTSLVKDYMLNYKLASFENFHTGLDPAQEDSVMAELPLIVIKVTDDKKVTTVRLWTKAPPEGQLEMDDITPAVIDREYYYGATDDDDLALVQRFVWDAFRAPLQVFTAEE